MRSGKAAAHACRHQNGNTINAGKHGNGRHIILRTTKQRWAAVVPSGCETRRAAEAQRQHAAIQGQCMFSRKRSTGNWPCPRARVTGPARDMLPPSAQTGWLGASMPSSSCNTCFALGRCRGSQSKHRAIRLCARWAEQTGRGNEPWCFAGWEHAHCTPVNLGCCGMPCSKRGRSIAVRVWCAHLHGRRPAIGHLQPPAAGDCRQNLQRAHACPCGAAAHQLPQQLRQRQARGQDAACCSGPCMQVEGARLQSWRSAAPRGRQGGSAVGRAGHQSCTAGQRHASVLYCVTQWPHHAKRVHIDRWGQLLVHHQFRGHVGYCGSGSPDGSQGRGTHARGQVTAHATRFTGWIPHMCGIHRGHSGERQP